ncbi:hypothetical protein LEP1GSC035_0439 [Leptospira noguchii str. 2007001578]|uniref:Uncharacterized protein n=2 Tax=Leptospira noguchii TaxID=28182 RepID=M6Y4M6_9LEPT|nr:hypothetical protein LEP1GSC035_0439 [Leptospira noguchii str. 2007001578]EMO89297.1 hypothetical protein LEP1GSC024_4014 [Leptospira noguchii str. 2001034031]
MGTQFYRGFVVIPTDLILRSKYLWGWLWLTMDRHPENTFSFLFAKIFLR